MYIDMTYRQYPWNTCPSCGHCPTCGRGGHYGQPYCGPQTSDNINVTDANQTTTGADWVQLLQDYRITKDSK